MDELDEYTEMKENELDEDIKDIEDKFDDKIVTPWEEL
jgi:hypothetical protein